MGNSREIQKKIEKRKKRNGGSEQILFFPATAKLLHTICYKKLSTTYILHYFYDPLFYTFLIIAISPLDGSLPKRWTFYMSTVSARAKLPSLKKFSFNDKNDTLTLTIYYYYYTKSPASVSYPPSHPAFHCIL